MTARSLPSIARPTTLVLCLSLVACTPTSLGSSPRATDSTANSTEPSVEQHRTVSATYEPSTVTSEQPLEPTPGDQHIEEPPAASLHVDGGDPVVGQLGSFNWRNAGTDAPWLPGNPIHIGVGETLILDLAEPVTIDNWTVSRQLPRASLDGTGAVGMAQGSGAPVRFAAPPGGLWSVHVGVWFANGLGSAAYYWLIEVS